MWAPPRALSLLPAPCCRRELRVVFWTSRVIKKRFIGSPWQAGSSPVSLSRSLSLHSFIQSLPSSLITRTAEGAFRDTQLVCLSVCLSGWWEYKSTCQQGFSEDARLGEGRQTLWRAWEELYMYNMRLIFTCVYKLFRLYTVVLCCYVISAFRPVPLLKLQVTLGKEYLFSHYLFGTIGKHIWVMVFEGLKLYHWGQSPETTKGTNMGRSVFTHQKILMQHKRELQSERCS